MGLGVMGLLLAGLLSCPMWLYLASRLGKYKAWLIQNFFGAATFLLFFIPRGRQQTQCALQSCMAAALRLHEVLDLSQKGVCMCLAGWH